MSKTYGDLVFQILEPIFAKSICEAWQTDFLEHDKRMLQNTAIPGMQYLWAVRKLGTHLVPLGVGQEAASLSAALAFDQQYELHLLRVTPTGCEVRRISKTDALSLQARAAAFSARRTSNLHGDHQVTWRVGTTQMASATVTEVRERGNANTQIRADLTLEPGLDPLSAMRVRLNLEAVVTQAVCSLFWTFQELRVNGVDVLEWTQKATRAPDTAPAMAA